MKLLLDTHVVLWLASTPERLGSNLDRLADTTNTLYVSAVSSWEITQKHATGRLPLPDPPALWFADRVPALGGTHLPITWQDTVAVGELPLLHRDPFDRLLVAQARRHGLVLVTADAAIQAYDVDLMLV